MFTTFITVATPILVGVVVWGIAAQSKLSVHDEKLAQSAARQQEILDAITKLDQKVDDLFVYLFRTKP